jgi:hypothetical protein
MEFEGCLFVKFHRFVFTAKLKIEAEAQRQFGCRYIRVGVSKYRLFSSNSGHDENIDIDTLQAFNLNAMEPGKAYPIGDPNFGDNDKTQDIPRLAVRRVDGTPPTYEIGTLRKFEFGGDVMSEIKISRTGIKKHDATFWERFRP